MRGFNYKKSVQILNYLAIRNNGKENKMKAIKLIWLSDRLSLRRYGRTISNDSYFALKNGPIPSATRDILEDSIFLHNDSAKEYSNEFILNDPEDRYYYISLKECDEKVFSKTDLSILNEIYKNFGDKDHFTLSEISHEFPEWKKYESAFNKGILSSSLININDFFEEVDEPSKLFKGETTEITKDIYKEIQLLSNLI